jgi:hypothetical protein
MKSLSLSFFIILFFSFNLLAQTDNRDSLKVWGNCGMCKRTIESAAKKGGALTAEWNKETKMLSFSVDPAGSSLKVQESIAAAGYDTRDLTASNDAYDKLPGCCKYDRKAASADASSSSEAKHESCGKEGCKNCKHKEGSASDCCKDGKCEKGKKKCKKDGSCEGKSCCKS